MALILLLDILDNSVVILNLGSEPQFDGLILGLLFHNLNLDSELLNQLPFHFEVYFDSERDEIIMNNIEQATTLTTNLDEEEHSVD